MIIRFSVHYQLKNRKSRRRTIYLRLQYMGSCRYLNTFFAVKSPDDFDKDKEQMRPNTKAVCGTPAHVVNAQLLQYTSTMQGIFARFEMLEKRAPSFQEVRDIFYDEIGHNELRAESMAKMVSFDAVFDEFLRYGVEMLQWSPSTLKQRKVLGSKLKEHDPKLTNVNALNDPYLNNYLKNLQAQGLRNPTIEKRLRHLRYFLQWASDKGYYSGTSHQTFKPKIKGTQVQSVVFLTPSEIKQIKDTPLIPTHPDLEKIRDVLLLACFTGLRFSDIQKLKKSDIYNDTIHVVTQKTSDPLQIELNKYARSILDKYKEDGSEYAIPTISNQKTNAAIKRLGKLAGITAPASDVYMDIEGKHHDTMPKWRLMSTHIGRRSFVCNALMCGIPAEVIMQWTGHKDYDAMKPYISIIQTTKRKNMSKFDRYFDDLTSDEATE